MSFFAHFQVIDENHKASVVRRLIEHSTPDFDFFYLSSLAALMATFGILADNAAIVVGSVLIAPTLYPILGVALGVVMSDQAVIGRSILTLGKSFVLSVVLAAMAAILLGDGNTMTAEMLLSTEATLISAATAIVAGLAISYSLARPEWNEALPGIATAVALIPPIAVVGIGVAYLDLAIITGSFVLVATNLVGIVFAAMISFSLMNLYEKRGVADSTIKREEERIEEEKAVMEEIQNGNEQEIEVTKSPM
jgi:uncharacterized hydrophobic protein (TIGR00271 family)